MATPIGNLQDITLRALEVLKSVDLIACEDTRHSGQMLAHFNIKKPLVSYFQHSKLSKIEYICAQLFEGRDIALITDAGTPGISDPGQALISKIREISNFQFPIFNQIPNDKLVNDKINEKWEMKNEKSDRVNIIPIPGASALAAAASVSGMIEKEFYFAGFLPKKKGRQTKFKALAKLECPIIIYESANRLERTLEDVRTYLGENARVFIAREATKAFEEYRQNSVKNILSDIKNYTLKGEVTLIVSR